MKIIIVGCGKVGFALAGRLTGEGHDIVLVESDREKVSRVSAALDAMVMCGSGASLETLKAAGAADADLLIAVTPEDEVNMICCMIARKLGCKNTIARVRSDEYYKQMYFLREELGLSMTINPELTAAREIFRLVQLPGSLKRDSFAKGVVEIVELVLKDGSPYHGMSLTELARKNRVKMLVCAVERDGECIIPDGRFTLQSRDKIYVVAASTALPELLRDMGMSTNRVKNAMIIGGGRIGAHLANMLAKAGTRVKVFEHDSARSLALAEALPSVTVINADGTDQDALKAENIDLMDAVITVTGMDEENILVSMYANYLGVPLVITKINRTEYGPIFEDKGIDCVISPKQLSAGAILRYVRAMQNTMGGAVMSVYYLAEGKAEAVEFIAGKNTKYLGVPLRELELVPGVLISCIARRGSVIIPGGSDTIEEGDSVIAVSPADKTFLDLNDIFCV